MSPGLWPTLWPGSEEVCRRRCCSDQTVRSLPLLSPLLQFRSSFPLPLPPPRLPGKFSVRAAGTWRCARCGQGEGRRWNRRGRGDSSAERTGARRPGGARAHTGAHTDIHTRMHTRTHARLHARRSCNAGALRGALGRLRPRPPHGLRHGSALPSPGERTGTCSQGCALSRRRPPPAARAPGPPHSTPVRRPACHPGGALCPSLHPRGGEMFGKRFQLSFV